jgi:hypothetical protein
MPLSLCCEGNTGEAYGSAGSDSDFNEDEAEEREAALLQQRHLDFIQEEDFRDTFALPAPQHKPKVKECGAYTVVNCTLVPTSVAELNPKDPYVYGLPGSGSSSQR